MELQSTTTPALRQPWNKGRITGQKAPFKLKEIWAIRSRLQLSHRCRELAMFNLAIDSKLRGCDLMRLRVCDISLGDVRYRACPPANTTSLAVLSSHGQEIWLARDEPG